MDWRKLWNDVEDAWVNAPLSAQVIVGLVGFAILLRLFGIIH